MKLLIWGPAPWAKTGYGRIVSNLGPLLAKRGFEVAYFAYTHVVDMDGLTWGGCPVFSARMDWIDHARDYVIEVDNAWKPDLILQVFDLFTTSDLLLSDCFRSVRSKLVSYSPVDSLPIGKLQRKTAGFCRAVVPQTKWAKAAYEASGVTCEDAIYHGIDPDIYHPRGNRVETRDRFGIPLDRFVVMIVQDNTRRKNLPVQLQAFINALDAGANAQLVGIIPNVISHREWDIDELWKDLAGKKYQDRFTRLDSLAESDMADLYSSAEVLLQCTHSEGFGLPVLEAAACATPTICTGFGSLQELGKETGWIVPASHDYWQPKLGGWQADVKTAAITQTLLRAIRQHKEREEKGDKASAFALANCRWSFIADQWQQTLSRIHAPVAVAK